MWFLIGLLIGCSLGFVLGCWWFSLADEYAPAEAHKPPRLRWLERHRAETEAETLAQFDYIDEARQAGRYQVR